MLSIAEECHERIDAPSHRVFVTDTDTDTNAQPVIAAHISPTISILHFFIRIAAMVIR
jgi:hypothetical protein